MDTLQAAKYVIVGWIKDWSMRSLIEAITSKPVSKLSDDDFLNFAKQYPFLPSSRQWYIGKSGNGSMVRKFVNDTYPKLSNLLWDTEDQGKRLLLAQHLTTYKDPIAGPKSKFSTSDMSASIRDARQMRHSRIEYHASRSLFKKASGTHWTTVK